MLEKLLGILIFGALAGGYALYYAHLLKQRSRQGDEYPLSYRMFFERTGYCYVGLVAAPLEQQVLHAQMTAAPGGDLDFHVVRSYRGLAVHWIQRTKSGVLGTKIEGTWTLPLPYQPPAGLQVADKRLTGVGKVMKEIFTDAEERAWEQLYPHPVLTGDPAFDARFNVFSTDPSFAYGVLQRPGLRQMLSGLVEVDLVVHADRIAFNDPLLRNLKRFVPQGMGGIVVHAPRPAEAMAHVVAVHDAIAEVLVVASGVSALPAAPQLMAAPPVAAPPRVEPSRLPAPALPPAEQIPMPCSRCGAPMRPIPRGHGPETDARCDCCGMVETLPADVAARAAMLSQRLQRIRSLSDAVESANLWMARSFEGGDWLRGTLKAALGPLTLILVLVVAPAVYYVTTTPGQSGQDLGAVLGYALHLPIQFVCLVASMWIGYRYVARRYQVRLRPRLLARAPLQPGSPMRCRCCGGPLPDYGDRGGRGAFVVCRFCGATSLVTAEVATERAAMLDREFQEYRARAGGMQAALAEQGKVLGAGVVAGNLIGLVVGQVVGFVVARILIAVL
jgi:hypothetical protein